MSLFFILLWRKIIRDALPTSLKIHKKCTELRYKSNGTFALSTLLLYLANFFQKHMAPNIM